MDYLGITMDDHSSQNKLITLFIRFIQSTFMNMENSVLHSSVGIENDRGSV